MIISEIRYNQAIERLRFDAEFYKPEFLKTESNLKKTNSIPLNEIVKFSKLRKNPKNEPKRDFQYIDISNVNTSTGDINVQILKGYEAPSRARKVVKQNDIIISTVRPNRNAVAIIPEKLDNQICSTGFAVIKAGKVNPWFLFAFFKTKYAINQLVRITMASMYPAVSENDIGSILVPIPPSSIQQKIESLVRESYKKRKSADKKYKEAEELLNKALGIEKLELKDEKIFETRFDEVENGQRMDADFYKPIFRVALNILKAGEDKGMFSVKRLGEIAKISKGIEVGSDAYADDGKLFLRVSNITEKEITISDSAEFIRENLFNELKAKYKPMPGEIIYTKDATIGIAFPIGENFDAIISSGIIRIRPCNDLDHYYLALVMNSILCRSQAEENSIGAVIKHYTYSKIKDLLVPIIPEEKQKQISDLVRQSFSLRKEAKELLEKAKKEVEGFIEKDNNHNRH
ncbi:MAG: restriction endonuclease subunit S [bacterium]